MEEYLVSFLELLAHWPLIITSLYSVHANAKPWCQIDDGNLLASIQSVGNCKERILAALEVAYGYQYL